MVGYTYSPHDDNVDNDQWKDGNNNIEQSVEPENIYSNIPVVSPSTMGPFCQILNSLAYANEMV